MASGREVETVGSSGGVEDLGGLLIPRTLSELFIIICGVFYIMRERTTDKQTKATAEHRSPTSPNHGIFRSHSSV